MVMHKIILQPRKKDQEKSPSRQIQAMGGYPVVPLGEFLTWQLLGPRD